MGTPEETEPVDPYAGYRFDPMTGKPLHPDTEQESAPDQEAQASDDEFTHYVHLADGRVIKSAGVVSSWHDSDDPNDRGVVVTAVYPRYAK
jgi:hypothetical protein